MRGGTNSKWGLSLHGLYKIKLAYGIQTSSQEEGVTMSVFLQMSLVGVGDTLRTGTWSNRRRKVARAFFCDVSDATWQSCKVTRAIRNVHDQPESLHMRPAVVSLI